MQECVCDDLSIIRQLIQWGYFPCTPVHPVAAVSIETLELYRSLFLRSSVSIEAFWEIIMVCIQVLPF